jgi:GT2 family glycosyltransferase
VVSSYLDRLPLTYLFEAKPGKNAALNLGLDVIEGDLVVLTDDDAVPRPDWLVQVRDVCGANPAFAVFGCRVEARWPYPPPDWVLEWVPMGPTFTISDPSLSEGPTGPSNVFGPNMVVRRTVFDAGHRFSEAIGPRGLNYAMGSETEFVRRLVRAGYTCWYTPRAVVEHIIEARQLDPKWILGRAERFGRGQYRMGLTETPVASAQLFGVPRYLFREIAERFIAALWWSVRGDRRRRFRAQWNLREKWGRVIEARHLSVPGGT